MLATKSISEDLKFTIEDYFALPEDGKQYEILDGELRMSPSPNAKHQTVLLNLATILKQYAEQHGTGKIFVAPFDIILSNYNVVQPDILFISKDNYAILTSDNIQGVPDLMIEILSPASMNHDRNIKRKIYARFGLPEYWLVHPEKKYLQILRLQAGTLRQVAEFKANEVLTSPVFPGLEIKMSDVFKE